MSLVDTDAARRVALRGTLAKPMQSGGREKPVLYLDGIVAESAPTYVHKILDAWLNGMPLNFEGEYVPLDVIDRLCKALKSGNLHSYPCGSADCERCREIRKQ